MTRGPSARNWTIVSPFVILDNYSILTSATKGGAIDFRDIRDGGIQSRIALGIGRERLQALIIVSATIGGVVFVAVLTVVLLVRAM